MEPNPVEPEPSASPTEALGDSSADELDTIVVEATGIELKVRRAEELRELADAANLGADVADVQAELEELADAIATLEHDAGPPAEETTLELMGRLEALGELFAQEHGDTIAELAQRLVDVTEREPIKTEAELAELAQLEELEKAREAYERKVRKIVGPEAPLPTCPTCDGLGFDFSGGTAGEELLEHADYQCCASCAGLGAVRTGSRVENCEAAPCPGCGGRGYLKRIEREHANGHEPAGPPLEPEYGLEPWMGDPAISSARS